MSNLEISISRLRKLSLALFLIPTIAIIGSLIISNSILGFDFNGGSTYSSNNFPIKTICNKENDYCQNEILTNKILDKCTKYQINEQIIVDDKLFNPIEFKILYFRGLEVNGAPKTMPPNEIFFSATETNTINQTCILNSPILYFLYKFYSKPFYLIANMKKNKKYTPATADVVNPLIYGETSISNIVKRFPINYFFKPLLYITSILMFLYWVYYQIIFSKISQNKSINAFLIFGVISSIFLFLHVVFLGVKFESEIFKGLRKLLVFVFLFSEIFAQYFLVRKIYILKNLLSKYINKPIMLVKIFFVAIIIVISILIIVTLIIFDPPYTFTNIVEWNYFFMLLFFYFLSSIMWKKNIIK